MNLRSIYSKNHACINYNDNINENEYGTILVHGNLQVLGKLEHNNSKLENKILELEKSVKFQTELIEALWYAPGMPGYLGAKKDYFARMNK